VDWWQQEDREDVGGGRTKVCSEKRARGCQTDEGEGKDDDGDNGGDDEDMSLAPCKGLSCWPAVFFMTSNQQSSTVSSVSSNDGNNAILPSVSLPSPHVSTTSPSYQQSWIFEHWPNLVSLLSERRRAGWWDSSVGTSSFGPIDCHVEQRKRFTAQPSHCTYFLAPLSPVLSIVIIFHDRKKNPSDRNVREFLQYMGNLLTDRFLFGKLKSAIIHTGSIAH